MGWHAYFLKKITTFLCFTFVLCVHGYSSTTIESNTHHKANYSSSIKRGKVSNIEFTSQEVKTRVIINPNSGTHSKKNIEKLISQFLNPSVFNVEILYTKGPNHGTELSEEAALLGYGLVIAVGGDGTINEVAKGLINSHTALGIIPSGSGNGFARHLNISSDPQKAIQTINQFQWMIIDTIQINNDPFIGIAGIGFDAHIAEKFVLSKKRGFLSYATLVLKEYLFYPPLFFEMQIDGIPILKEGFLISFANSSQYGNDIKIAPKASLCDGYLDLVILKKPPFYLLGDILIKLKSGTIANSIYYEAIRCKEIVIRAPRLSAHIDGEPIVFENEITLRVLPKSLKVIAP